ncbi:hypothetical protein C8R48DRAFT_117871 [Suillus tomentosus]|nr:hypothetical protein C8R48DRAFT_117871 [Suillus tomentosus]
MHLARQSCIVILPLIRSSSTSPCQDPLSILCTTTSSPNHGMSKASFSLCTNINTHPLCRVKAYYQCRAKLHPYRVTIATCVKPHHFNCHTVRIT